MRSLPTLMRNLPPSLSLLLVVVAVVAMGIVPGQAAAQRGKGRVHTVSSPGDVDQMQGADAEAPVDYTNYSLLRIQTQDDQDVEIVRKLELEPGVDLWQQPSPARDTVDVLVSPSAFRSVQTLLHNNNVSFDIRIADIKSVIDRSRAPQPSTLLRRAGHSLTWKDYHRFEDIKEFVNYVGRSEQSVCSKFELGRSFENRSLVGIKCGTGEKIVFIEGGVHAREWISPAVVTYMINELLMNQDDQYSDLLSQFTIFLVPVLNPDGYEYSHTHNRLWRKTRSKNVGQTRCVGTDPNRNFDIDWLNRGSSSDPCSDIYAGPKAFSEKETQAVRDFVTKNKDAMLMYLAIHSYSQLFLIPYAYTNQKPANFERMRRVAETGAKALQEAGGPQFGVLHTYRAFPPSSGGSDDWAKQIGEVPFSYTIELRDQGKYGFLLPPELIEQSGKETMAAVAAMIREANRAKRGKAIVFPQK